MSSLINVLQNSTMCKLCGKICTTKDWVIFDGKTGLCKCRTCMSAYKYDWGLKKWVKSI